MEDAPLPNKCSIMIKSDKKNSYQIYFTSIENYLLIQAFKDINNSKITHENKIPLIDIRLNKYFSICESIYDVLFSLKQNLTNNVKLEEINDDLQIIIPLNHPLAKEISFNLKNCDNNLNKNIFNTDLINSLLDTINSLSEKINEQQKEINDLKKRVTDLENNNTFNKKTQTQNAIKKDNTQTNSIIKNNNNSNINNDISIPYYFNKYEFSNIIKSPAEEISIKNWIYSYDRKVKFKLLFRMSEDGNKTLNFHIKCDHKGKTLILLETKEGKRMGGYTSLQWNMDGESKYGENVWLFTLGKNMFKFILEKQNKKPSIICNMNNGPSFEEGIVFKDNDLSVGFIENSGILKNLGIIEKKINIKELEVFQVFIKY